MSNIQTGTVLKHLETDADVVYKAAIPTLGNGLIHLLVGAGGYLLKFTTELEQEFDTPTQAAPISEDPFGGATSQEVQELLRLLRAKGGATAAATTVGEPAEADVVADPSPEEADLAKAPQDTASGTQDAPAPAPSPSVGGIAL
jgi:hypothetical protein